ncbi:MAG: DOMON domain-containing protein [Dehalogenimonas sp.]
MIRGVYLKFLGAICAIFILLIGGCSTPQQTTHTTSTTPPELDFPVGSYASVNTYSNSITIAYTVQGDTIAIGLKARTTGWVAIALGNAHGDSDVILGWVANGQVTINDTNRASKAGLHQLDVDTGGTNDVNVVGGSEISAITTLEFTRKLVTGDTQDLPFLKGNNTVTWAIGPTDAITSHHSEYGFVTITIP